MKKALLLVLICTTSFAQQNLPDLDWTQAVITKEKLGKGIVWTNFIFNQKNALGLNENINVIETKLKNRKLKFGLASADTLKSPNPFGGNLRTTSHIAKREKALVAVNGGFFDMKNGGAVDYIRINKQVYDTTRVSATMRLPFKTAISALIIKNNRVEIVKGEKDKGWENQLNGEYVLLTGPLLIYNHEAQNLAKSSFNDNRHPRTAACITQNGKFLLITVDGRSAESEGFTLPQLTKVLVSLNCKNAINFDGGGSTTLYIKDKPANGIVNYPSDNGKFDHEGERQVSNIFYLK